MFSNMLSILFTNNELAILSLAASIFCSMLFSYFGYLGYPNSKKTMGRVEKTSEKTDEKDIEKIATEILIKRVHLKEREANKLIIENNEKEQDLNKRAENLSERENNFNEYEKDLVERENLLTKKYKEMEIKEQFLNSFEQSLNARREFMLEEELLYKDKLDKSKASEPNIHKKIYKDILYVDYKDYFILSGFGTKKLREEIKKMGGNWVPSHSFWIFNNSEKDKVQFFLNNSV